MMASFDHRRAEGQGGFALLEVLIALIVSVIGVLGLIGLQARSYQAEAESYQRAQALVILEDIASRVSANRGAAADYVADGVGAGVLEDCASPAVATATPAEVADRDLCEIANALRGAAERAGSAAGAAVGAMSLARACIASPAVDTYLISVVWAGVVPTGAPASACGAGQYGDEGLRRAVSTVVVVADLEG